MAAAPRPLARPWVMTLVVGLVALAVFLALGATVDRHVPFAVDDVVRDYWLGLHRPASVLEACDKISFLGSNLRMVWVGWVAALVCLAWRRPGPALALALATFATGASYPRAKALLGRARPFGARWLGETTYSFPSGHATAAAAILAAVAYLLWREGKIAGPTALVLGAAAPIAVGLSRVCLEAHWMTDVIGGWALGLAIAAASVTVYELIKPYAERARIRTSG